MPALRNAKAKIAVAAGAFTLAAALAGAESSGASAAPNDQTAASSDSTLAADDPISLDPNAALLARISGVFDVEDPSSIYDFAVKDKNVEFIVDGSWAIDIDGALTLDFSSGTPVYGYTPPVFTQTVDLVSWIFLDQKWYFESSFAEGFTRNTVAAGYLGDEDSVVKHVRVGNSGISFPDGYTFVQVGGGVAIAPGAMGTFAGKNWNADALVRYDAAETESLTLAGMNEVTDSLISVTAPTRGKWFVLPDENVRGTVSVYVEDEDGSITDTAQPSRRWRKLSQSEFTVSGVKGVVELDTAQSGCVAIAYGSGTYSGLKNFVTDTANYLITEAKNAGRNMPEDFLSGYDGSSLEYTTDEITIHSNHEITLNGSTALLVRHPGYFSPFDAANRYASDGDDPSLVYSESGVSPDDLAVDAYDSEYAEVYRTDSGYDSDIREPEGRFPLAGKFPYLYLANYGGKKPDTDLSVRSRAYTPITTISLGEDVVAGTIQVTRNGITDTAFSFDDTTGILTLTTPPGSTETVKITWYKTDEGARNGTVSVAGGVKWRPNQSIELFAASALRWNLSKDGYTDSSSPSPGSYVVSTGVSWNKAPVNVSTAFAFEVQVPDTTGYYRILGMDTSAQSLYPDGDWYTTALSTISMEDYITSLPVGTAYVTPENVDGTDMPYITDSSVSGDVQVIKATLTSSAEWTGSTIAVGTEGGQDLSSARSFEIALKNAGIDANFDVYLQFGVDADSDWEDSDTIVSKKIDTTPAADSSWKVVSVSLTDDDRAKIAGGNDVRVIIVPTSYPETVKLETGPIEITQAGFGSDSDEIELTEREDPRAGQSGAIAKIDSSVINRFNSGSVNTVTEVAIDAPDPAPSTAESYTITRTVPAIPLGSYEELSFYAYVKTPPTGTVPMQITLENPDGSGSDIACLFTVNTNALSTGTWHKITVNLKKKTIEIDDSTTTNAYVSSVDRTVSPTRIKITYVDASNTGDWTMYLDEFHLAVSNPVETVRNRTTVDWSKSGAILSAGSVPILSNPKFSATTDTSTIVEESNLDASGTASAGVNLLKSRWDGSIGVSNGSERTLENESHAVSIPFGPVALNERYASDFSAGTLDRADGVSVSGPLEVETRATAKQSAKKLLRTTKISLSPNIPSADAGDFTAELSGDYAQTGVSPYPSVSDERWGDLWTESFLSLLSDGESDASKRTGENALAIAWSRETGTLRSVKFYSGLESTYVSTSSTELDTTASYGFSFPLAFDGFSLTPSWKRAATESRERATGGSWTDDTRESALSASRQRWLFTVLPIADLWDASIPTVIAADDTWSRAFSNRYGLEWARPSPGVLADLWTPSTASSSIARKTTTDATADNVRDEWTSSVTTGFSALNVAGKKGSLGLFSWYDQDEIAQIYGWSSTWTRESFEWSVDAWDSITLYFEDSGTVSLENTWHYDSPDESGDGEIVKDAVSLVWKRPGKSSFLTLAVARLVRDRFPLTTRREDSATWSTSVADDERDTSFSFDHRLVTGIGKNGQVSVTAGTTVTDSEEGLQSIELRLGIGGKLSY